MRDPSPDLVSGVIMMVDDEPTTLDVMEMFLREDGFAHFVKTTNATQVLELLAARRPDVVLLNFVMPDLDGFGVLERMHADASLNGIPVILVTSSTDAETKRRAVAHGVTDFLSKPIDRSELSVRVRNTLAARAGQNARLSRQDASRAGASAGNALAKDAPPLVSRLDARDARCRKIIEKFVKRLEERLLAMEERFDAGDLQGLATLGHWLKGAAGTVGFDAFTQPAETLRVLAHEGKWDEIGAALAALRELADRIVVVGGPSR